MKKIYSFFKLLITRKKQASVTFDDGVFTCTSDEDFAIFVKQFPFGDHLIDNVENHFAQEFVN